MASKTARFCPFCNQQPQESGLYYLQSRYYDPEIGRFINADAFVATGQGLLGNNMFAYCSNNPVNMVDMSGQNPVAILYYLAECVVIICAVVFALSIITSPQFRKDFVDVCTYVGHAISSTLETIINQPAKKVVSQRTTSLVADTSSVISIISQHASQKPVNLPSFKKLKVDMSHIKSGHMPNGPRNPNGNKSVFWGLTTQQILKAIQEAYNNSSKIHTQGVRVLLKGFSSTYTLWVEMWVNLKDLVIETAYPK